MKVALLISGYLRTFKDNLPSIKDNIVKTFNNNVDIYIHVTKDEQKKDKYLNPSILYENINLLQENLNPICLIVEEDKNFHEDVNTSNLFSNWSKFFKLNNIKKENEKTNGEYDLVIKYRPDLNLTSNEFFNTNIEKDTLYIPKDSKIDKTKLKNLNDCYICDSFCYGSSKIMDQYFEIYPNLQNIIDKYSNIPENVLCNYLNDFKIKYELVDIDYQIVLSKCNVFGICGDSGSGKTTLGNILKKFFSNSFILECDRYHKWERGNENWQKYTHLNPEANYISKMNEDIFNLKIGNSIFQVDYDHKNGKFTENKLINSSENIIVCGLHSLYNTYEHLYDLKIYVDTDFDLKKDWKIKRDVIERGHSLENVLKQIDKRKDDYEKYILPQRNKSDLVINFFSENEEMCLKILINKQYDVSKILKTLNTKEINYSLSSSEQNFLTLTFHKYKSISLWDNSEIPILYNFYDYIIYVILNISKI